MVRFLPSAAFAASLVIAVGAHASASPIGLWLTQDHDGIIAIEPCGASLCGSIVGSSTPAYCHKRIMNLAPSQDGAWSGHITDPRDNSVWQAELRQPAPNRLDLRGYVALKLFGRTQSWTRYTGRPSPDCKMG